jgi:hypothetical protein
MRSRLVRLAVVAGFALALGAQSAPAARTTTHLSGGGTASVGGAPFSQVAMNVAFGSSGSASGNFNCLMAGRSKAVLPGFGLKHIMKVHATPTKGSVSGTIATFSGPGFLIMDGGQHANIEVSVWVNVATQQFQLTVLKLAPSPVVLPTETFSSGGVRLR